QAGWFRAGWHVAPQLHAAARPGCDRLRQGKQRGAQASQAYRYARLHVRDPLPATSDPLCCKARDPSARLCGLLERIGEEVRRPAMKLASLKGGRDGRLIVVSRDLTRAADAGGIAPTL